MKKFKTIFVILLSFVTICFGIFACNFSLNKSHNLNKTVAVNDITTTNNTFLSSNILFARIAVTTKNINGNSFEQLLFYNAEGPSTDMVGQIYNWSFKIVNDGFNVSFYANAFLGENYYIGARSDNGSENFIYIGSIDYSSSDYSSVKVIDVNFNGTNKKSLIGISNNNSSDFVDSGVSPTLNMSSVEICNYTDFTQNTGVIIPSEFTNCNVVSYVDTAGYRYSIFIPCYDTISSGPVCYYSYRRYYLNSDLSDNDIYLNGYQAGLSANQQGIYNKGYNAGKVDGYNNGYSSGVEASNKYTFMSLISAVLDAPLNTFTSLFNFELLGVNLLQFFTGLLTFGIVIWLMKLFLGGR